MISKTAPRFLIIEGYYIPADSAVDPARHSRKVVASAQTPAWAQVLAARAFEKSFVYGEGGSDYDDQGYTEVWDVAAGRRYQPPRALEVSGSDDLPF